jgi:chromosome segregation and condensation protein ScpB
MAKSKEYYEHLFIAYPDVVTLPEFCKMLGGIADGTARKLMRKNIVRHFYIRDTYMIPKIWVIQYVLSEHYSNYKQKLMVQI